jgi:hypothetical protein
MKLLDRYKSHKIMSMIDEQIVLRMEAVHTLISLKRSMSSHMYRGQLNSSDIREIKRVLKTLGGSK